MADISELLADKDPETLKRMLELRDKLQYDKPTSSPVGPAEQSAEAFKGMPRTAAESAETFENMPKSALETAPEAASSGEAALGAGEAAGAEGLGADSAASMLGLAPLAAATAGLGASAAVKYLGSGAAESDLNDTFHPKAYDQQGGSAFGLPNGGMSPEDAMKKYGGGPEATTGYNPNAAKKPMVAVDKGDDEEDDDGDEDTRGPAALVNKLKNLRDNPPKNPPPISQTLGKLLNPEDDEMRDARNERSKLQLLAMLGHGSAQIGAALTPLAHTMPDNTAFNTLMQAAQQPIQDIKDKKALNMETLKQKELLDKIDPNSSQAHVLRSLLKQAAQKAGVNLSDSEIQSASPATMENIMKGVESLATHQENAKNRAAYRDIARENKESDRRDKVDQHVGDMLESSRQTPDVKQAYLDSYSASKALTLLDKYPDLNKMSNPQVSLIAAEVAKIAQGGVPGMDELRALKPDALPQWFSKVSSKLINAPTAANAGAFLKQYKDYVTDLKKNSKDIINDKIGRVVDVNESKMNPGTAKLYKEKYLKPLEGDSSASKEEMVNVISPEGQVGQIPRKNLEKAKSRGFKEQQ